MRRLLMVLIPLAVVAGAVAGAGMMIANRAEPQRVEAVRQAQTVEYLEVRRTDVDLSLPSQGMIEPERLTVVASEVAGRVIGVAENFNAGEAFAEGEELVEIDPSDFAAAATQAEAALADARLALATEQARAEQVVRDWGKLASDEKPTDFALRKPHLESAAARVKAAESALVKSRRDLERTKIRAPFRGRLRAVHTELGAVLAPGARVAEMFSTGGYEVRLPLSLDDYAFAKPISDKPGAAVRLTATVGGREQTWQARAVRFEGEVERASRSVYLVARVGEEEDGAENGLAVLKPGLFVRAEIEGQTLPGVFRVPRRAFLDEHRLLTVDQANLLHFRSVQVVRAEGADLLVSEGLEEGERVCLTPLAAPIDGMTVKAVAAPAVPAPEPGTPAAP